MADLTNLQNLANAISNSSPAIKRYALEQVRVSKEQELRLQRLEARLANAPAFDPAQPFTMNKLAAVVKALRG